MEPKINGNAEFAYTRQVGERLRAIRQQKRLSLQDVEEGSEFEFKASVLGAYERGERAISVPRLHRLAQFYNIPVDQLLPRSSLSKSPEFIDITDPEVIDDGVTIDLQRLKSLPKPQGEMLSRYLVTIQVQRQDFNGRVLTVRDGDLNAVACILEVDVENVVEKLEALNLIAN